MATDAIGALHRLAPAHRADSPEAVARSLVALHATDPASVHLAVAARTAGPGAGATVAAVDRALHDDRSLVRVMGMRRTLWVVPADTVPVVVAACGRAVGAHQRRILLALMEAQGVGDDPARLLADLEEQALAALGDLGGRLFDTDGNAGPTVWYHGRVVGGWAQRPGGEVVTSVVVDVGREGRAAVAAEAARLEAWLAAGGLVVRPRFPTPLQKELAS